MKIGRFILNPLNKFLYVLILQDAFYCMVIIKQLSFGKSRVDLPMTNSMKQHYVPTLKCARDHMMLARFFGQWACAQRTGVHIVHYDGA